MYDARAAAALPLLSSLTAWAPGQCVHEVRATGAAAPAHAPPLPQIWPHCRAQQAALTQVRGKTPVWGDGGAQERGEGGGSSAARLRAVIAHAFAVPAGGHGPQARAWSLPGDEAWRGAPGPEEWGPGSHIFRSGPPPASHRPLMWELVEQYGWYGLALLVALYAAWPHIVAAVDRARMEPAPPIGASSIAASSGRAPRDGTTLLTCARMRPLRWRFAPPRACTRARCPLAQTRCASAS